MEKKESIFKSDCFIKLFLGPYVTWVILTIIAYFGGKNDSDPMTLKDLVVNNIAIMVLWFIISFIVSFIVIKVKGTMNKKNEINNEDETEEGIISENKELNEDKKKGDFLFYCESIIDVDEYKKMAKYFPNRMYWVFVYYGTFINLIFSTLVLIATMMFEIALVSFIIYEMCMMLVYRVRLEDMAEKKFNKRKKQGMIDKKIENEFYDDYFIRKGKNLSLTINYSEISKCIETDTNFYLEYPQRNFVVIIQKDSCDLELINFIKEKFKDLDNQVNYEFPFKPIDIYNNPDILLKMQCCWV